MIIYLLGFLDLWTGALLIPASLGWIPFSVIAVHSLYLFIKGMAFWGDIYSILDVLISIYLLLIFFGLQHALITGLAAFYLLQKAALTFKH
jgi:hypothetical protein